MELFVVHNPQAGDGSWSRERLERMLRERGHAPTIVDAASEWMPRLQGIAPDAFVAVGGDGTFQRLAVAAAGRPEPIAILPTGTANNIALALGGSEPLDLAECVARWGERERVLQLAEARVGSRRRPFVEVAGAGAFVRLLRHKPRIAGGIPADSDLLAGRRRLFEEIRAGDAYPATLTVGHDTAIEGDFLLIACLNLPSFGARVVLAPAESADSGLLTVCAVRAGERAAFADWLMAPESDPAAWVLARGPDVVLETAALTHLDDRVWPAQPATEPIHLEGGVASIRVWS